MSEVFSKIQAIIVAQLGVSADDVVPDAKFIDDLFADSFEIVELIMAAEEEFDIMLDDSEIVKLRTVQDVVSYIEGLQEAANG